MTKDRDDDTGDTGDETPREEQTGDETAAEGRAERDEEEEAAASEDDGDDEEGAAASEDDEDDEEDEDDGDDEEEAAASEDDDGDEPRARRAERRDRRRPKDQSRLLVLIAVLLGVAGFAGLWWSESGSPDEDAADTQADEGDRDPLAAEAETQLPDDPFGQGGPQRPEPIPAPPDVAEVPDDAERSESGLAWRVLEEGTGTEHPGETDLVTMHYTGWTTQGQMVDSSVVRGEPATLPLDRGIPGWTEGVQLMVEGEKRRFWVPPELAATPRGAPPGPIVFDIELIDFEEAPPAPEAPATVSGPPPNAERTESGLAYRVLEEGTGTEHPSPRSRVRVHFTGWSTDGEMLETSVTTGEPALLPPLQRVLPGMREGLELMVEGEKRRLWIPEELAFAGRPGAPEGMIVFDIELVEIVEAAPGGMPGMPPGMPPGHPRRPPPAGGGPAGGGPPG